MMLVNLMETVRVKPDYSGESALCKFRVNFEKSGTLRENDNTTCWQIEFYMLHVHAPPLVLLIVVCF